jgi:capsid protein
MLSTVSYVTPGRNAFTAAATSIGAHYDATDDRGRRRPPVTTTASEDYHANERRRQILSGTTRDLARNFVIAAWCIRKHLDYVADFTFSAATTDPGFNKYLEAWQKESSRRQRFDVAHRHPHRRGVRLAEAGKSIDGDQIWLKLAPPKGDPNRGTIQAIEGDRVAMPAGDRPPNTRPEDWVNGFRLDPETGRLGAVAICKRVNNTRKQLQRIVPADHVFHHAAYEFRVDQARGISPIASAVNWFRDTYEGFEFALAKAKIGQLFGIQIFSHDSASGPFTGPGTANYDEDEDADQETTPTTAPRIDLKRGIFVTEMDPGEKAEILESKTPSTETVSFLKLIVMVALRSLDIPYSFWDESFTNFYGSRGGLIQYLHSCHNKVLDLQDFQNDHFLWRAGLAIEDGELELPSGKDISFLKWEFVPGGVPWWDPAKEARGHALGVKMGSTSPQRICREIGTNFFQNIDETAEAMAYAAARGVPLSFDEKAAADPEAKPEAPADE